MSDENDGKRTVTFRGEAYTLYGEIPMVGSAAPEFRIYSWWNATRVEITLASLLANGVPILLSVVSSVDTPISRLQVKNFDLAMSEYFNTAIGVQISSDLPNTINRFFAQEEIHTLIGSSDYYDRNFGQAYGLLVEEPAILTRAVLVIGKDGTIRYVEVLREITSEPNYFEAMTVLADLVDEAQAAMKEMPEPDEGNTESLVSTEMTEAEQVTSIDNTGDLS